MTRPVRIALTTIGCKLNQYETDAVAASLRSRGYAIVAPDQEADIRVVNTCTVTNRADRKSRNAINRAARDGARVVATGCYVEHRRAEPSDSGNALCVDNAHKASIPDIIDAYVRGEIVDPDDLPADVFGYSPPDRTRHTRANVKIQDGCDAFCSFCIIPRVRGSAVSRRAAAVINEITRSVDSGAREIVLTGVNLSRYDSEGTSFIALIRMILDIPGKFRIRLSSLEPDRLNDAFVELFAHEKMTPHLHLCLQSGSDTVLRAMNRTYDTASYSRIVERLRAVDERFNITTDMLVGFPGESEDDFARSVAFAEEVVFGHIHTFPYSVRSGTAAAHTKDHVPVAVASRRAAVVREVGARTKRAYRTNLIGTVETVLVESIERGDDGLFARGLGQHYVPVSFPVNAAVQPNTMHTVAVRAIEDGGDDPDLLGISVKATGR